MISAGALRKAWGEHARFSPVEPVMALIERGLVLGAATVLAKRYSGGGRAGLALDGAEERLLALLAVAYGRAVPPSVLGNIRRAARDWGNGDRCLALIHLAHSGLPQLEEGEAAPFRLFAADRLIDAGVSPRRMLELLELDTAPLDALKAGFDPDEPRVPAGNPDGGQWTDGEEATPIIPAAARDTAQSAFPADKDLFFDTLYGPVHELAQRLGIDESWLLGLAAHESGWLKPHNRAINDPFGVTHAGGPDVHYRSMDEAVAAWERRYGPVVQGATSAENFVQRLLAAHYNVVTKEWPSEMAGAIRSVQRRLGSWKSRHVL